MGLTAELLKLESRLDSLAVPTGSTLKRIEAALASLKMGLQFELLGGWMDRVGTVFSNTWTREWTVKGMSRDVVLSATRRYIEVRKFEQPAQLEKCLDFEIRAGMDKISFECHQAVRKGLSDEDKTKTLASKIEEKLKAFIKMYGLS